MKRRRGLWAVVLACAVLAAVVDVVVQNVRVSRLARTVSECGGGTISIGVWPLGSDISIRFDRVPVGDELRRLSLVVTPRGSVAVVFVDCEIDVEEARAIRAALPRWGLFQVVAGESPPLPDR